MFAYTGFVVAVVLVYTIATEIVNLIQTYGVIFNLSNTVMGVTLLAWGNTIPDVFADVALAKQGFPRMSFSASFGGPLFSILLFYLFSFNISQHACHYSADLLARRKKKVMLSFGKEVNFSIFISI